MAFFFGRGAITFKKEGVGLTMNILERLLLKLKRPEKKQISSKVVARIIHDLKEGTEISVVKTDGTTVHGIFLEGDSNELVMDIDKQYVGVTCNEIAELKHCQRESDSASVLTGYISAYYIERHFGFLIENVTQQTFFFRDANVLSETLKMELSAGHTGQKVQFVKELPAGAVGKYPSARILDIVTEVAVRPKRTIFAEAYKEETSGNVEKAMKMYLEIIEKKEFKYLSAIKNLATLYNRTGDPLQAVELLDRHRAEFPKNEQESCDQMKVKFLCKAQMFREAADLLEELIKNQTDKDKIKIYRKECEYYRKATENPDTPVNDESLLENSPYIEFLCSSASNMPEAKDFSENIPADSEVRDKYVLEKIDETKKRITQVTIPGKTYSYLSRDKMEKLVSLAHLELYYTSFFSPDNSERTRWIKRSLNLYFFFSACLKFEEALVEQCDSFQYYLHWLYRLNPSTGHVSQTAVVLLLLSYAKPQMDLCIDLINDGVPSGVQQMIRDCLGASAEKRDSLIQSLPFLYCHMRDLAEAALNICREAGVNIAPPSEDQISRFKSYQDNIRQLLNQGNLSTTAIHNTLDLWSRFDMPSASSLQARDEFLNLLREAEKYITNIRYVERHRSLLTVETLLKHFCTSFVADEVSFYSGEYFYPAAAILLDRERKDFSELSATPPVLSIGHVGPDRYQCDNDQIILHLRLRSEKEVSAPISSIMIIAGDAEDQSVFFESPLQGGESREFEMKIVVSQAQKNDQNFDLHLTVEYVIGESRKHSCQMVVPVGLQIRPFVEISNPYPGSIGTPISGPMFVGRTALITEITDYFMNHELGQCYVLFGQRRSGKSSIKNNILREIQNDKLLYTQMDFSDLRAGDLCRIFADQLIKVARTKIDEIAKSSWNYPAPSEKNLQEQPGFEIKKLGEELRRRGYRWIIGIDEFTRLNDILEMGDECFYQVRELLRIIKARLEDKSFSAFIVGQNSISCLLAKFPNEMAVTKSHRLLYLSKEAVFKLAEEPILQPDGSSRFNSGALNLLYDLTAGHPYFTQKFCYRLVNFLNAKKYLNVTESCIQEVENIIIHDLDYLNISEFECLWQIPVSRGSSIGKEDILKMLYKIASIAKDGNWCPVSDLLESPLAGKPPTASAVSDNDLGCLLEQDSFHFSSPVKTPKDLLISLCQHGTIEFFDKRVRIKVRLFADWLNANNWG